MELVRNQKLDLYIRFPAGFDEAVAAYDMGFWKGCAPGRGILQLCRQPLRETGTIW